MINERKMDEMMLELGHAENILGTGYLRRAVHYYDEGYRAATKELYPAIAKSANTTASRVERAMRHSITSAWGRGSLDAQRKYFGFSVHPDKGAPTVMEYVARMQHICHEEPEERAARFAGEN